ncbi:MAG: hypothetical protein HY238_16460, partial [Acidobacteria bacterium]|nr:hypothetical protein [Acidobacteriota bacterium]
MSYYKRRLPHWDPSSAALFVTWRLYGSLPPEHIRRQDRETSGQAFARTDRILDLATAGPLWLNDTRIAQCVVDALHYGEQQLRLYDLDAWVIMANHVHVLWRPHVQLARITKSTKNYTALQANRILDCAGRPFWQHESYDHWVRNPKEHARII